jgi:AcrR family transcriptional regulator
VNGAGPRLTGRPLVRTEQLRRHVIATARELFEDEGVPGLRARRVATAAGTSTAALHDMVGTKGDLARALFLDGFTELDRRITALGETGDAAADVVAHLAEVRAFAARCPMLFELMFARPLAEFAPAPEDWRTARALQDRALRLVARYLDAAGSGADPVDTTHALLALNRGLIAQERSGLLGRRPADRDRRWAHAVHALLAGCR